MKCCTFGSVGHMKCDCRSPLWKTPHKHNRGNDLGNSII